MAPEEHALTQNERNEIVNADPAKTHVAKTFKHNSPLISCRIEPTGKFVFAGAQDSKILRWEIESGAKAELAGHKSWVRGIAFDPKSEWMVTGGYEGDLLWWPVAAEKPAATRTVKAHQGWVRAVTFSPDGTQIASCGNDNLVKLWKADDGSALRTFAGHDRHVYNVAFHPSGKQIVSCDLMGNFIHWDVETGKQERKFAAPSMHKFDTTFRADIGGSRGMEFSDDGKLLACGGITNVSNAFAGVGNPIIVLFDWEAGKEKIQHLAKGNIRGSIWGLAMHRQGFTIGGSGGGGGGLLFFWKPDQKNEFHKLKLPNTIKDLDLHPDGQHIATAHHDSQLRISKMAAKA